MGLRLLRLTPWRRGPLLLLRRPGVAVALLAAALVAALPAAAAPMFLSSAQHATLHRQVDETCLWRVGAQFTGPVAPKAPLSFRTVVGPDSVVGAQRYRQRQEVIAAHPVAGLTAPVSAVYGDVEARPVDRPLPLPDLSGLRLLARTGFEEQVEVLAGGGGGAGLWLPHEHARQQGIEVGDELRLTIRRRDQQEPGTWTPPERPNVVERAFQRPDAPPGPEPEPVILPVVAIYRDLRTLPASERWCGVEDGYLGTQDERRDPNFSIPPMALVDPETFLAVGESTLIPAQQIIELAVTDPRLTAPEAERIGGEIDALQARVFQENPELFPTGSPADRAAFTSFLDRYQRRAALVRSGLLPPVVPITAAGTLVGLAVAAAAAVFWVQRRRRELAVLAGHGVGAAALGVKAVLEAVPAVLAGSLAGWAAAWALVAWVGPSPVLAPGTLPLAGGAAAAVGLVGLVLIGRLAAAGARGLTDTRPVTHRRRWWQRVPWELAPLAAAPAAWWSLAGDEVSDPTAGGVGTVAHVPARLLVVPILVIAGLAVLAARLLAGRLTSGGRRRTPAGAGWLLARRRLVRHAATTAVLAAATAVPVAMAAYGAAATDSIRTTADGQLRFNLGSDTVLAYRNQLNRELDGLGPPPSPPESMAGRATAVLRLNQQRLGGLYVDVLAVDPDTFDDGAYWDSRIGGASLADAVGRLTTGDTPTVVASRRIAPGPDILTVGRESIPVRVADTRPLPGAQNAYPMVIIDRDALAAISQRARDTFQPQIWVAGDPQRTEAETTGAGLRPDRVVTIDDHRVGTLYEPVTYTFQYLIALSVFTGLIGAVGLLLYLESRTAAHRRGYVMLRRLGLSPGAHRRALLLELFAPVVTGLAAGLAAAVGIAYLLRSGFDLAPDRFPDALLALPVQMAAVVTAAAVVIAVAAALLTHARISRARPGEVLRDAG